jgi:hypothetical protein
MSSRNWLFGLILIVVTVLAYQPAWNGKPIWDDDIHITSAELRSLHGLGRIWTDPAAAPQYSFTRFFGSNINFGARGRFPTIFSTLGCMH